MRVACLTLIALALISGCASRAPAPAATTDFGVPRTLSADELLRALRGRTLEGVQSDRSYVRAYLAPDGKVSALVNAPDGAKHWSGGVWEVREDAVCFLWRNRDWTSGCARMVLSNGGGYAVRPLQGGPNIASAKILDGNPYGLGFN